MWLRSEVAQKKGGLPLLLPLILHSLFHVRAEGERRGGAFLCAELLSPDADKTCPFKCRS